MYIVLHVGYPLFLSNVNYTSIFLDIFLKNFKFRENPSSGSGRADRQTDMTKLIVAFLHFFFANAPKNTFL